MRYAILAAACLTATACGALNSASESAAPTTAAPAPTVATTVVATAQTGAATAQTSAATAAAPTASAGGNATSTQAAGGAPTVGATARDPGPTPPGTPNTAAQTSAAAATSSAGGTATPAPNRSAGTSLVIDASASHASYHAREQLVGRDLPSDAVGTSNDVSGAVVFNSDGSIDPSKSQVRVDLSKLTSDQSRRDGFVKSNTLETNQFPMATFTARDAAGLPSPLPSSGQANFQLSGDLTVHGVTKPVIWQVTAQFDPSGVTGSATTDVNISDFGMTPPKAGPVLSIQDTLTLELAFTAARDES
jgi:polyisoprenoid-binding protein YceI